jgi:group I intron endonuclease
MATYLESTSGIYKITSITNGKIYIGCASNVRTRINGHLYNLRREKHNNIYLQRAWTKYGEKNFVFEIIEKCDINDLHVREHYWVNKFNCLNKLIGYNLKPTDPNGCSLHSEETKEKLRIANKGKKPSLACIEAGKIYNASKECRINLIEARKKLKNVDFNIVNAHKRKSIKNIITNEVYESLAIAANTLNIPKYELSRRILGKRKNNTNLIYL